MAQVTEASLTALYHSEKKNCYFSQTVAKKKKRQLFFMDLILSDAEHVFVCMVLSGAPLMTLI